MTGTLARPSSKRNRRIVSDSATSGLVISAGALRMQRASLDRGVRNVLPVHAGLGLRRGAVVYLYLLRTPVHQEAARRASSRFDAHLGRHRRIR